MPLGARFLGFGRTDFWGWLSFLMCPILFVIGCFPVSLTSAHSVLVKPTPQCVTTENVCRHCLMSPGRTDGPCLGKLFYR